MLVLTRKESQSVVINKNIRVTVLEVTGSYVKIGIQAPNGVDIARAEILKPAEGDGEAKAL